MEPPAPLFSRLRGRRASMAAYGRCDGLRSERQSRGVNLPPLPFVL
jgi:hypothetical protein